MAISQLKSKRKPTGGRYKPRRKEKSYELGELPALTKLEKKRLKVFRTRGNNKKMRLLSVDTANVFNPSTKKYEQLKIKTITDNPANSHFTRRNIMTKGSIIDIEKGKARITSRPGQDGTVNAILIS